MVHYEPKLKYPGKVFMHTSSLWTKDFIGVGLPPPRSVRRKISSVKVGQFQIFNFEFSKNFESFSKFHMSKILSYHTSYLVKISAQKLNSIKSYSKILNISIFP